MVKGFSPEWGIYDAMPDPTDENGREYYISQEVWSFAELCYLISGVDPNWESDPLAEIRWSEAKEKINRGKAAGTLQPASDSGEIYFLPKEAISWAQENCGKFPFAETDLKTTISRSQAPQAIGDKKTLNLHKIIGLLALQLAKRQNGGTRTVGELFNDFQNVAKSLEDELINKTELSMYGIGKSSFYNALQKGQDALKAK